MPADILQVKYIMVMYTLQRAYSKPILERAMHIVAVTWLVESVTGGQREITDSAACRDQFLGIIRH